MIAMSRRPVSLAWGGEDYEELRILSHVGFDLLNDRVKLDVMARMRCDSGDRFLRRLGQSKDHCRKLSR